MPARLPRHQSSLQAVQQFSAATGDPSSSASSASTAGGAPGHQQQPPQAPPRRVKYSPLHYNIEQFCQEVVPTEEERQLKLQVIEM